MQVLRGIFTDTEDTETRCWVLNGNRTYSDILMREDLEDLLQSHGTNSSGRLRIHHTLTAPPDDWTFSKGRITTQLLQDHLPEPGEHTMICLCGPVRASTIRILCCPLTYEQDPMQETVKSGLQQIGYDISTSLVVF